MKLESIGEDRIDAINWTQDRFGFLRSIAEDLVTNSIKSGKIIITENGVFLTEEEDEFDENIKKMSHNMKKGSRTRRRFKKFNNKPVDSNDGVEAADDMLNPNPDEDDES